MPVTVSYPGVYIEEFAPGAPIQGVGTSTAAFIGTAVKGPANKPTLIQSWDAFQSIFGGFITHPKESLTTIGYLAPAVYGFFLNDGTKCYVLRVTNATHSTTTLLTADAQNVLKLGARQEGSTGNDLSVGVSHSAVDPVFVLRKEQSVKGAPEYDEQTKLTKLTVGPNAGFADGDQLQISKDGDIRQKPLLVVRVVEIKDETTLIVNGQVAAKYADGIVRTADLSKGSQQIRMEVPKEKRLFQIIPPGSTVKISGQAGGADVTEYHTVELVRGDVVTLANRLDHEFSLTDANKLPSLVPLLFKLTIYDKYGNVAETLEDLGLSPKHPRYCVNMPSKFVTLEGIPKTAVTTTSDPRPAEKGENTSVQLTGGIDDARATNWQELLTDPHKYLDYLKPYSDVAIVCIPGATDKRDVAQRAIVEHCQHMKNRFAILDARPRTSDVAEADWTREKAIVNVEDQFGNVQSEGGYAALYFPWIKARNPATGEDELWPPSGHIAGAYARTDAEKGVHKAPANTNLRGAFDLEWRLTDSEQGPLNLKGINVLRVFPGQGQPLIWGARTTATDRNWQYVNIRRLFMFLEESIAEGIRWAVFEPNNLQLWQKLKRSITEFLTRVWRAGALFGATPDQAFYVRIDEALNGPDEQKIGRLNIEIGVRPTYAAEFIVVRIGIWDGGSQVSAG
jgi:hypothetical protein